MRIEKAIAMIEDYIREPNSIDPEWYEVMKLCKEALLEKQMRGLMRK